MKLYYCPTCKAVIKTYDHGPKDTCPNCKGIVLLTDVGAEQWQQYSDDEKTQVKTEFADKIKVKSNFAYGLTYHKFIWYFLLPINIVFYLAYVINYGIIYGNFDIGCVISIVGAIAALVAFIGFFKWKTYSFYSILVYTCLVVLFSISTSEQIGATLIAGVIYAVINFRYYTKRKELFFRTSEQVQSKPTIYSQANNVSASKETATIVESGAIDDASILTPSHVDVDPQVKIACIQQTTSNYCHKCGAKLHAESVFCSICGEKVLAQSAPVVIAAPENDHSFSEGSVSCCSSEHGDRIEMDTDAPSTNPLTTETNTASTDSNEKQMVKGKSNSDANVHTESMLDKASTVNAPRKRRRLIILSIVIGGLVLISLTIWGIKISKENKQFDTLSRLNGCPELYGVEWGMSKSDVLEKLPGNNYFKDDNTLSIECPIEASLGDASSADCYFNGDALAGVQFVYDSQELSSEYVVEVYEEALGPSSQIKELHHTWMDSPIGDSKLDITIPIDYYEWETDTTRITVSNMQNAENTVVRWQRVYNSSFSFDGAAHDPCGFISTMWPYGESTYKYTRNLVEDEDYVVIRGGEYTSYVFFPYFSYLGVPPTNTAIELSSKNGNQSVSMAQYSFAYDTIDYDTADYQEIASSLKSMYTTLKKAFGECLGWKYALPEQNVDELHDGFSEAVFKKIAADTPGHYYFFWELGTDVNITLGIIINNSTDSITGGVSYSVD